MAILMSESQRMTYTKFNVGVDGDGIALITWDAPGSTMNLIDMTMIAELSAIVEELATDGAVKGVIITSGKDTFCAGADLTMLEGMSRTFAELVKSQGEEAANARLFAESRKRSLPSTERHSAAASNWRSPVTAASPRTIRRRALVCRKSRSACFRAPVAPSASRDCYRRQMRCSCCSRAISYGSIGPRR